jgi:protease-4
MGSRMVNSMKNLSVKNGTGEGQWKRSKWVWVFAVIGILTIISYVVSGFLGLFLNPSGLQLGGNVALIPVEGVIVSSGTSSPFGGDVTSSTTIVNFIDAAEKNPGIKAILLEVNSPGGSAVASDEVAAALKRTNKTTVAYIREVGASGGYLIASAADYIFVNKMSITGSIGVLASYIEISGLMQKYNVTYERLVAGKYKDIGSPYKKLTDEERSILEEQLNSAHETFVEEVARNRGLSVIAVKQLATGEPIIGTRAKELGLVDAIGGKDEAVSYIEQHLNITASIVEYREKVSLLDMLTRLMGDSFYRMGLGIGNGLQSRDNRPIVWM